MAKRRRPQPRDGLGRFTTTGVPLWFALGAVFIVVMSILR